MYLNPALLPQFSNREDFLMTFAMVDDNSYDPVTNTYQFISLTGTTLAGGPGGPPFTGNNWIVTDGAIATTSSTLITIPTFPIGNQLSTLSLTVAPGLGILAGDPITIADPTHVNSMTGYVTGYTPATGALTCQIGCTFQFEIRIAPPNSGGSGYVPWYDFGTYPDYGPLLSASLGNGITIVDMGVFQIFIPETQFRTLGNLGVSNTPMNWGGTYRCGLTLFDGANTRQLFIGRLPVFSGGVTT